MSAHAPDEGDRVSGGNPGGLEYLQDISRSAHPLDMDQAVAEAWGQPAWADYSGVSRTLSSLSEDEVTAPVQALERVEWPPIRSEPELLRTGRQRICYDGDLTELPVSNSSTTYPQAELGFGTYENVALLVEMG